MMNPDKTGLLKSFLGGLNGQIAARLAVAVEVDRLLEGKALPHDDILDSLRPILQRDHFARALTPLRLFCRPFQDILTSTPRITKQKGVIARRSLVPVWNWVSKTLIPEEAALYFRDVKKLVMAQKNDEAIARAAAFWPVAGAAMRAALTGLVARKELEKVLGDVFAVEDADEMALLLGIGGHAEKLAEILPKPVPSFTGPLVWEARAIYEAVIAAEPDAAAYVPVMVMNRLARPWEALRLPIMVTRKTDETLICKTDMGLVGEILFARMDGLRSAIQTTRHPLFDEVVLMDQVKTFADLSSNIVKEIELKREGEWGRRLLAERVEIGKVMESFMDRAPREVAAALPTQKGKGADFSKTPSKEKQEMALRYARLVAGSRNFAAAASFAAKQRAIYEDLCTLLKSYNEDVVRALKCDPASVNANIQLLFCTDLTALLFSEEEAELLRRRGRAALNAA